ncbi:MAG: hypothetical protein AB1600_10145, partial [Bacteroidota bacterium]
YIIKYVTPVFLLIVFIGAFIAPAGGDWTGALQSLLRGDGWNFDSGSIIGKVLHIGYDDTRWFVDGSPTRVFIVDLTRILLLSVFIGIALLIKRAWKNHQSL